VQNDGSDWSLGTPSVLIPGWGVHDAWLDLDGQLWFTCNIPNRRTTIGKIDPASGAVKLFKVPAPNGLAGADPRHDARSEGIIWFNVNNGRGGIGRLDPDRAHRRLHAAARQHVADRGATTVDYDGKEKIWSSAPDGAAALRSETETFTEFKSVATRRRVAPGSLTARPAIATATAGGRK
jgi:streptogramin lyase